IGGSRIDTLGTNRVGPTFSSHSHNMAGIVAAEGVDLDWRGVAYEALVLSYDDTLDLVEMDDASVTYDLRVSNHSYGPANGWGPAIMPDGLTLLSSWWGDTTVSKIEDYHRGFYDEESVAWDLFAATHPAFLPVLAAGNDRDTTQVFPPDSLHWFFSDCVAGPNCHSGWSMSKEHRLDDDEPDGYDSILGGMQSSKNVLSVGAVYNLTGHCGAFVGPELAMSFYSSWGPTDDGRIKPDLVAPGSRLRVPTHAADSGGNCIGSGTSHSAPVIAGGIGLMLEHARNNPGVLSTAASMKALLLHSATDLGNPGPDYQFGWGLADLAGAARILREDSLVGTGFNVREDTLDSDETDSYVILSNGTGPLKATAVWMDPPGLPVSDPSRAIPKSEWLDNDVRMLVNDLDLVIESEGGTFHPWTLSPLNPSALAVRTVRNELDNVEQVLVDSPDSAVYVVEISHTGPLEGGIQPYSVVLSGHVPTAALDLEVFLEGPYAGGSMSTGPLFDAALPAVTSYGDSFFDGTSAEHDGSEWLYGPPGDLVDWMVVSVRSALAAASEVARRSALIRSDGKIVDIDGGALRMSTGGFDSLFVVVDHRNHAAVMTPQMLSLSSGSATWDFTTSMSQAYTAGGSPMKNLGGGVFGLFACDSSVDGQVTAPDFNLWNASTTAGETGYRPADCNLDGQVTAPDFNLWNANTTAGAASQVP
ncbi:MAG TPA: S8 family serine peptidase, partial [Rhodothermales bacterium]|nr:S8 family serine peptidase [Rhodothermales bacterium]